ncbi:inositol 2-dehydrogenase-like [Penaeus japonicus]|nr:inositol 2-dehydrogenase-like [Penaeus japonicus]
MLSSHNERPYQIKRATEAGDTEPPILHSFPSRYYEGYVRELDHFCDVVQGLDDNMLSGENTLRVSIIASALEESVKTGQAVKVIY